LGGNSYTPNSTNVWQYRNNIFLGQASAWKTGQQVGLDWYSDGTFGGTVKYVNNIVWNVRYNTCPSGSICKDPQLVNETLAGFYQTPLPSSPAIDNANSAYTTSVDFYGTSRPVGSGYDIGAVEYRGQAWLGGDSPPVPSTGGTQSSDAPVQASDAPVPVSPVPVHSTGPVRLPVQERYHGLAWGDRLRPVEFGDRYVRDARLNALPATTPGSTTAAVAAGAAPPRAADAPVPVATQVQAKPAVTTRSYLLIVVAWFKDAYRRLAML
jgi:hypothetical protein